MFLFLYLNFLMNKELINMSLFLCCILLSFILVVKLLFIIQLDLIKIVCIKPAIRRMRNLVSCLILGLFLNHFIITYSKLWSSQKIWSSFNEFLLVYWIQIFAIFEKFVDFIENKISILQLIEKSIIVRL